MNGQVLTFLLLLWSPIFLANGPEEGEEKPSAEETASVLETVTVTAERRPVTIKESTAKVSVIDDRQIAEQLINDVRDLIKYEPGVTVENDGSRLGLNGFRIRGVGGNRVLTQVDGIQTAEQFDFGPFSVHQYFVDMDLLKSVEIVRSASSSLYGSDALGGVVSFVTKDPEDFLDVGERDSYGVKTGYDSETETSNLSLRGAFSMGRFQGLITATGRDFGPRDNQGSNGTFDRTRTEPNDIDGISTQFLAKGIWRLGDNNRLRATLEGFDSDVDTDVYTSQGLSTFGLPTEISDSTANDQQQRLRLSLDQAWDNADNRFFDTLQWKIFLQTNETQQSTSEQRITALGPASTRIRRTGSVDYEDDSFGADLLMRKTFTANNSNHGITYGASFIRHSFGQFRDRRDLDLDTGNPDAYTGTLVFPTRYFPNSDVTEIGVFVQGESYFLDDRLKLVPGVRFDSYDLSPDENDRIFLDSTGATEPPVGMDDSAVSPKLGIFYEISSNFAVTTQYAQGFRAPPYSSVNSGFSNFAGGYQTLANPDLDPETSENLEFGFKAYGKWGTVNVTYFDNQYEDFIQNTVFIGVSDMGLSLFQPQNIDNVGISGIEIAGDARFNETTRLRFSFADTEGENSDTGDALNTIDPWKGVVGLVYRDTQNRFGGELSGTFAGAKDQSDVTLSQGPLFLPDSYSVFDLTIHFRLSQGFQLFAGAFNITDEDYFLWSDVLGRPANDPVVDRFSAPGRNFSVNINYQW